MQERETNRLRSQNHDLIAQEAQLTTERDKSLSAASQKNDDAGQFRKANSELLKLRGEVGMLRKQAAEMRKLREENKKLRASLSDNNPGKTQANNQSVEMYKSNNFFPKGSWAFAGYASPESALQTWVWAMDKGDKDTMLASLAPEAQTEWKELLNSASGAADLAEKSPFVALSLISKESVSDNEVAISFVNDFPDGKKTGEQKMRMVRIGSDWKIAGPANE